MSHNLRFKAPGIYQSDNATVSTDPVNGGMLVLIKVPEGGYVGIMVPLTVLIDILENQGYGVVKVDEPVHGVDNRKVW